MFKDRRHAGRLLVEEFGEQIDSFDNSVIIALPRGGVPVAYEISIALQMPLDIFSIKKISLPSDPELALGATTEEGKTVFNMDIVQHFKIGENELNRLSIKAQQKARDHARKLRGNRSRANVKNKNVILVDDGIATGATIKAAIELLKKHKVARILLAVPVCPRGLWEELKRVVDDTYILDIPGSFHSVGQFYEKFPQVHDEEVLWFLSNPFPYNAPPERRLNFFK